MITFTILKWLCLPIGFAALVFWMWLFFDNYEGAAYRYAQFEKFGTYNGGFDNSQEGIRIGKEKIKKFKIGWILKAYFGDHLLGYKFAKDASDVFNSILGSLVYFGLILLIIASICMYFFFDSKLSVAKNIYNSEAKVLERSQQADFLNLIELTSQNLTPTTSFVNISEPTIYVIAPMSYDTTKYINDNSNIKGFFGSSDKSAERLTLLESCITDFQSKIDTKLGVSFLDRTKIAQIEKEHKFQLGDWSNDKKTAEVGKALNANVMLFLDKFGYINDTDEIRFEAKFVDINTMRSTQYNLVYKKPAKKVTTPEIVNAITFKDFSGISTKKNPFEDEIYLKVKSRVRTAQKIENKDVSPLGKIQKIDFSEYDVYTPKSSLLEVSTITFDGFGSAELKNGETTVNATYTFEPIELNIIEIENGYYSDGKIGTLILKIDSEEEKCDIFTQKNKEYFLKIGSAKPDSVFINYYLQTVKQ